MNVQNMTDAEVYELALDILFDKLGHAGLIQFLRHCKPCTGDYTAERQKWINDDTADVKTIVKRIQERRKLIAAETVSPKSVDDMSDIEIYEFGLKAISLKLGPIGIVRFVHLFDADDLSTSTSHVYEINPACHEKGTDEQTQCEFVT